MFSRVTSRRSWVFSVRSVADSVRDKVDSLAISDAKERIEFIVVQAAYGFSWIDEI